MKKLALAMLALMLAANGAAGQTKKTIRQKPKPIQKRKKIEPSEVFTPAVRLPSVYEQPLSRGSEILKLANAAHGGAALDNLKTLRLIGRMRVDNHFYDYKILVDTARNRVREESRGNADYFYVRQAEETSGWVFAGGAKRPIEDFERRELQKFLFTRLLGLRGDSSKNINLKIVEVNDYEKIKTLRGEINGETYSWGFDGDNLLISESVLYKPETNTTLFDDFRTIENIKFPHRATTALGSLLLIVDWTSIEANVALTENDWAVPQ